MKIRKAVITVLCCAAAFALFPFAMLANRSTAYFAYKEITYKTMADRIACGSKAPERSAMRISEYFHRYLFTPLGAQAVDKDTYNDIIRGIAYCDQRAWGMSAFLAKRDINSRMVMTVNPDGMSNHTALEVFIDGGWRYFDPQYALIIRRKDGELASYSDICKDPSLLVDSQRMQLLKKACPFEYGTISKYLEKNVFNPGIIKPVVWSSPARSRGRVARAISGTLDIYVAFLGRKFSCLFQDAYLGIYSGKGGHNTDYLLARNYDIYGRFDKAVDYYRKFIGNSPLDAERYPAMLYLSIIYTNNGDYEAAISTLRAMMGESASKKWSSTIYYWLGYNYEARNDKEEAADCFRISIKEGTKTGDPSDMVKLLELDSFERIAESE
ncbi:MAG: tetratricopeptide repeat protein [Candidatus Omnitrophica bacterium]|nr:tetratricopeptide repeat protein [Candidatus Omnitrophota bacterium]MDD5736868.1 tetratricopeptide repeat protein [Candidatus Omnitrophota bacterium]